MLPTLIACACLGFAVSTSQEDPAALARALPMPALERSQLAAWRTHLRPTDEELAYEAIPWIPDFATGLRHAQEERKPLLLWAMNGHPLACT